ncbi:hypothetical protein ACEU6E_10625 (plasmid) [Halorutilales archaeon Cl-col2-1]
MTEIKTSEKENTETKTIDHRVPLSGVTVYEDDYLEVEFSRSVFGSEERKERMADEFRDGVVSV